MAKRVIWRFAVRSKSLCIYAESFDRRVGPGSERSAGVLVQTIAGLGGVNYSQMNPLRPMRMLLAQFLRLMLALVEPAVIALNLKRPLAVL
jgi:hypothetical protein